MDDSDVSSRGFALADCGVSKQKLIINIYEKSFMRSRMIDSHSAGVFLMFILLSACAKTQFRSQDLASQASTAAVGPASAGNSAGNSTPALPVALSTPIPIATSTPLPTISNLPTPSCYFWASGIFPSDINDITTYQSRIGDVSLTWELGSELGGEEIVGNGSYPNNFAIFPRSSRGTWDGAAIPAGVRLQVWAYPNFQGPLLIDEVGPKLLYSTSNNVAFTKTFAGALQAQYPQSVRKVVAFPNLDCTTSGCKSGSSKVTCN